jgi:uncharacterized protein (UPF0276 family)
MFAEYIRTIFHTNLNELRILGEFADEEVILLMDGSQNHVTEAVFALLRDARVRMIIWDPYMTQIFRQLDVSLFEVLTG